MEVFGTVATAYAGHRPDYAGAAVRWAITTAPGSRVLDLGAGTGKLTATLLAVGADVTAVEPDQAMLAPLRAAFPQVRALTGSAESIPLPDASVDVVVAGSAVVGPRDTPVAWRAVVLDRIRVCLAGRPETADGEFVLPMLTCGLRARWA
jgi:SAM-dependent methyltransferase